MVVGSLGNNWNVVSAIDRTFEAQREVCEQAETSERRNRKGWILKGVSEMERNLENGG